MLFMCMYVCACVCVCVCYCLCVFMCLCVCVYVSVCVFMCVSVLFFAVFVETSRCFFCQGLGLNNLFIVCCIYIETIEYFQKKYTYIVARCSSGFSKLLCFDIRFVFERLLAVGISLCICGWGAFDEIRCVVFTSGGILGSAFTWYVWQRRKGWRNESVEGKVLSFVSLVVFGA